MLLPDLHRLAQGDPTQWDYAFDWLWGSVLRTALANLHGCLPAQEAQDVAIEALEEVIEKVQTVERIEELKLLAVCIARNRAVDRLRRHFAEIHGGGKVGSLEALEKEHPGLVQHPPTPLDATELAGVLGELLEELSLHERGVLVDFYVNGLSYKDIAAKYGIAPGTVGVLKSRAAEKLRRTVGARPTLKKELQEFFR